MEATRRYKRGSSIGRRKKEPVSWVSLLSSDPWPVSVHQMGATCPLSSPPYPWIWQLLLFSLNNWCVQVLLHHLCAQCKENESTAAYPLVTSALAPPFPSSLSLNTDWLNTMWISLCYAVPFSCLAFHVRNHDDYLLTSYYCHTHIISLVKSTQDQDPPWRWMFA